MFEKRKGFESLLNCSLNVDKGIDNCAPYSTYCASSPVQFNSTVDWPLCGVLYLFDFIQVMTMVTYDEIIRFYFQD